MIGESEAIMNEKKSWRVLVAGGAAATLTACGSGGGAPGAVRSTTPAPVLATAAAPTLAQSLGTPVPLAGNAVTTTNTAGTITIAANNNVTSSRTINSATQVTTNFAINGTARTASVDPTAPPGVGVGNGVGVPVMSAQLSDGQFFNADSNAGTLSYASFGYWSFQATDALGAATGPAVTQSYFGGRETPAAAVPSAGTATYTGRTLGLGATAGASFFLAGDVSLTANFASAGVNPRTVSGDITSIITSPVLGALPVGAVVPSTIVLSGGAISGNTFTGAASALSGLTTIGSGTFTGKFFGNTAQEVAGSWSFQSPIGSPSVSAVGSFGAKAP